MRENVLSIRTHTQVRETYTRSNTDWYWFYASGEHETVWKMQLQQPECRRGLLIAFEWLMLYTTAAAAINGLWLGCCFGDPIKSPNLSHMATI